MAPLNKQARGMYANRVFRTTISEMHGKFGAFLPI